MYGGDLVLTQEQDRDRRFRLARVLHVTERMLQHAQSGRWQEVEELEAQRLQDMEACCNLQELVLPEELAEALATLLVLNEQLVDLVRHARRQLDQERNLEHSHGQRVLSATLAYSGDLV